MSVDRMKQLQRNTVTNADVIDGALVLKRYDGSKLIVQSNGSGTNLNPLVFESNGSTVAFETVMFDSIYDGYSQSTLESIPEDFGLSYLDGVFTATEEATWIIDFLGNGIHDNTAVVWVSLGSSDYSGHAGVAASAAVSGAGLGATFMVPLAVGGTFHVRIGSSNETASPYSPINYATATIRRL